MSQQSKEYELARLILKLSNNITKNRDLHLKQLDLTARQADSLQFLSLHENATITDLKNFLGSTHQTARGIVQRMVEKEFLILKKSEKDARFQVIVLSDKGIALERRLKQNGVKTGTRLLKEINSEEQTIFLRVLDQVYRNVQD